MATPRIERLSDAEKELLGNYRASLAPAPARKAKAWAALGSLAKAGTGATAAGTTKLIVLSTLSTATLLGGAAWIAAQSPRAETPASSVAHTKRPNPTPPTHADPRAEHQAQKIDPLPPDATVPEVPEPTDDPVHENPTSRPLAATAQQPRASDLVAPRRLEAEARSLEKMRSALSAGRHARVLSLVSAHRMDFEHAVFAEEVDGVEVMASCRSSPDAKARDRLAKFASRYPASPQTPALRRACEPAEVPVQRPSKTESNK